MTTSRILASYQNPKKTRDFAEFRNSPWTTSFASIGAGRGSERFFVWNLQAAAFFMMREQMDCYCRIWAALLGTLRRLRPRKPYLEASITRFRADLNVAPVLFYDPLYGV
jgi:hypothetical protein